MKTLKCEQVYLDEHDNLTDANARIGHFLEAVYKQITNRSGCSPAWVTCRLPSSSRLKKD